MSDKNMEAFHDLVKKAKGLLITPQLLKGRFHYWSFRRYGGFCGSR